MQVDDPYRVPAAQVALPEDVLAEGEVSSWREGRILLVLRHRPLPPRCVKCNADTPDHMRKRRFWWTPVWVHLILLGMLVPSPITIIVFPVWLVANVVLRRSSQHVYGLCDRHRHKQALRWVLFVLAWACAMFFAHRGDGAMIAAFALMIVILIVAYGLQTLRVRRIEADFACFAGCGKAFLDSLPPLSARNTPPTR